MMIKESIFQGDMTILDAFVPKNRSSKYMKAKTDRTQRRNR